MPEIFERLTHLAEHAIGRLKVSSALNSCLWLSGITIPFGFAGAVFSTGIVQFAALLMAFIPVVLFVVAYVYFMLNSPDKLRSEEYELRKLALELIEEKGGLIPLSESSVEAIANSEYRALPKLPSGGA